ncbi:MAG: hypothetical protein EU551_02045 [Promethearchaeota archaeon]|nr:MAG: hypothetical protein EU551_02045 [Candidatus Lokiarchaeota archaeon]
MTNQNEKLLDFIKLRTGIENLDTLLRGGFEPGLVHIYGPPATGKSNFAMQLIINAITKHNAKPVYLDLNGTFSFKRMIQLADYDKNKLNDFRLLQIQGYDDFINIINSIDSSIEKDTVLLVIDPITYFYRLTINKNNWFKKMHELNEIILTKLIGLSLFKQLIIVLINQITGNKSEPAAVCQKNIDRYSKYSLLFYTKRAGKKYLMLKKSRNIKIKKSIPINIQNNKII